MWSPKQEPSYYGKDFKSKVISLPCKPRESWIGQQDKRTLVSKTWKDNLDMSWQLQVCGYEREKQVLFYNKILQGTLLHCWHKFGALFQQQLLFEHTDNSPISVLSFKAFCTSAVPKNYSFISLPIITYILIEGNKLCCLENIYGNSPYLTSQFFFKIIQVHIFGLKVVLHLTWVIYSKTFVLLKIFPFSSTLCFKDQQ